MDDRALLKRYGAYKQEAQFLRDENRFLRGERDQYRIEWCHAQQRLNTLEERSQKLQEENRRRTGQGFSGAKADKIAKLLETLATLGQARVAGEGKYAA